MLSLHPPQPSPPLTQSSLLLAVPTAHLQDSTVLALRSKGYQVELATHGRQLMEQFYQNPAGRERSPIQLLVLDTAIAQLDSLNFCHRLRSQGQTLPILLLSTRGSEDDKIQGLEAGADDYLVYPVGTRELVARCHALLRRAPTQSYTPPALQFRDIELQSQSYRVTKAGKPIALAPREYKLLEFLLRSPQRVWSRQELLDFVWGENFFGDPKTLDVHIRHLRSKLERDPANPEYIVTVRGWGYRLG